MTRVYGMTAGERIGLSYDVALVVPLPSPVATPDVRAMLGGWWTWLWSTGRAGRC